MRIISIFVSQHTSLFIQFERLLIHLRLQQMLEINPITSYYSSDEWDGGQWKKLRSVLL
jgi:hypothetical protein